MNAKAYYPLCADLAGRRCLVVGGGAVAQRKVAGWLGYGADVLVVSPSLTPWLAACARQGRLRHRARTFRKSDLRGAWLAVAASDDRQANRRVFEAATRARIFANVVDQPALCSFIAPAIARRGPLTVAVSTSGLSPSLAQRLRDEAAARLGKDAVPMLRLLGSLRGQAKRRLPTAERRKRYFRSLVRGRVFRLVRAGHIGAARRLALVLLARQAQEGG